ncbi:hypothetical protein C8Q70DRAFT_324558 [Cubamyces menziesii]|nr:hypothetical protein C8Q70DRAFT_324558 [Cubamyces menziesii]
MLRRRQDGRPVAQAGLNPVLMHRWPYRAGGLFPLTVGDGSPPTRRCLVGRGCVQSARRHPRGRLRGLSVSCERLAAWGGQECGRIIDLRVLLLLDEGWWGGWSASVLTPPPAMAVIVLWSFVPVLDLSPGYIDLGQAPHGATCVPHLVLLPRRALALYSSGTLWNPLEIRFGCFVELLEAGLDPRGLCASVMRCQCSSWGATLAGGGVSLGQSPLPLSPYSPMLTAILRRIVNKGIVQCDSMVLRRVAGFSSDTSSSRSGLQGYATRTPSALTGERARDLQVTRNLQYSVATSEGKSRSCIVSACTVETI